MGALRMKLSALIAIAVVGCASPRATLLPAPDPIFGVDKVKHFFIAGFIESMTFAGLQAAGTERSTARFGAIGTTAVVSFGREIHDRRTKGLFSTRDLFWDGLGAGAALIVINKTQH